MVSNQQRSINPVNEDRRMIRPTKTRSMIDPAS